MQVNFNFCQQPNTILNANSINRSVSQNGTTAGKPGQPNQDRVDISPQGKAMNAIENLMKQKEALREQRTELVTKTSESGGSIESIKEQLEFYDEQLTELDKQIKQLSADSMKQAVEKDDEKKSKNSSKNKTEEQLESEHMTSIAGAMDDVKNAEKVASVKSKVEGEVRVERSEINIEQIDVDRLESKTTNVDPLIKTAKQSIASKTVNLAALEEHALSINPNQHLKDANEKIENEQPADQDQGADSTMEQAAQQAAQQVSAD